MNMVLHGVDAPRIAAANSLRRSGRRTRRRAVWLTSCSPTRRSVAPRAPRPRRASRKGVQTAETAWRFLYTVMEALNSVVDAGSSSPTASCSIPGSAAGSRNSSSKTRDLHTVVDFLTAFSLLTPTFRLTCSSSRRGGPPGNLVLPGQPARGSQEVHEDPSDGVRGIRRMPAMVGWRRQGVGERRTRTPGRPTRQPWRRPVTTWTSRTQSLAAIRLIALRRNCSRI